MTARSRRYVHRSRTLLAAAAVALIALTGCSSGGTTAATSGADPSVAATSEGADVAESLVEDSAVDSGTTADPATDAEVETSDPAEEPAGGGDDSGASSDGVCGLAMPTEISGLLKANFDTSTLIDSGTVPNCLFSSSTGLGGASIGVLTGGAGELDEQVQILTITAPDGVVTDETVNGAKATLVVFDDLLGYPNATIMMVQGDDLLTAWVTGVSGGAREKVTTDAVALLEYLTTAAG